MRPALQAAAAPPKDGTRGHGHARRREGACGVQMEMRSPGVRRDSSASLRCAGSPARLGEAAAGSREVVQGPCAGACWQWRGARCPPRLLPLSGAGWDVSCLPCPGPVTRLQSDLSFIPQPGLFKGSPACWCHGKWTFFGTCPPQGPLHTHGLSPAAGCIHYPAFSSAPPALCCSTVMPSE